MYKLKKRGAYVIVSLSGVVYAYLLYLSCFEKVGSLNLQIVSFVVALLFNASAYFVVFSNRKKWIFALYLLIQVGIFALSSVVYFEPRSVTILENQSVLSTIRQNMILASIMFSRTLFRWIKMSLDKGKLE